LFGKRKKYSSLSDDQLIAEYKLNQDNNCVGELYKRYTAFTFSICLKYLKNKELARDAVLEIFEDLLEKLFVHDVKNFRSWLYTVAKNHCLLKTRNKKLNVEFVENYEKHQNDFMEQERILNPEYIVKEENIQKLEKCIMQLKPEQKSCIELFFIQEKSYNEIVEITGFSYKEVKTHIQNGKRNLEILLKKIDEKNK
jgi:RNA polymerase sigma-70 factor (ECF subfamily)